MPDAKITLTVDGVQYAVDSLGNVSKAADQAGQSISSAGEASKASSQHVTGLTGYLNELTPSTKNAGAAFTDLKGTLSEMWENPTGAVHGLASAVGGELTSGLGSVGVAAGLAAGALAGVGLVAFELGENAASVGGTINDMSEKMSLSAEGTSKLKYAMDIAGGSIEQASNLIFQLQRRMADSPEEMEKGLGRIGLSIHQLEDLQPDQQLYAISKAFQENTNSTNRAATAMEIFSRSGRDAIPLLMKDLSGLSDEAERLGYVWSDQDAKAAEEFEMSSRKLHERWTQMSITVGKDLIPAMTTLLGWTERTGEAFVHIADLGGLVSGGYHLLTGALGENALAAETAAAKQDTINKALSLGAPAGISFGDAVKYINEQFGRTGATVDSSAVLVENWYKALDEARQKSDQAAAADKALTDGLAAHGVVMGALPGEIDKANQAWDRSVKAADAAREAQRRLWEEYNSVGHGVVDTIDQMDGAVVEAIKYDLQRGVSVETLTKIHGVYKEQIQAIQAEEKFLASVVDLTTKSFGGMAIVIPDLTARTATFRDELESLYATFNQFSGGLSVAGDQLDHVIIPAFSTLPNVAAGASKEIQAAMDAANTSTVKWHDTLQLSEQALSRLAGVNLGPLIKQWEQIQNGGSGTGINGSNVSGGQVASSATQVGLGVLASATDNPDTKAGQVTNYAAKGAIYGSIVPGLGTAVGAGVGALVGALKVSPEELAARSSLEAFEKQFGTLDQTIHAVGAAYAAYGKTGAQAEHDLKAALDASHVSAAAEGAALGTINTVLQASAKFTTDVQTGVSGVTTAAQAFGGTVPDQFKAAVTELANMRGITDEEKASLLALTADVKPNFDQLTQTASTYGITLAGLGPKFQQANLEGASKKIFDDFTSLTKAGADVGGVLLGMSGKINDLVDNSIDFGTAIPENMRPMIQNLLDSGKLTDDAGQKLTDMTQIKFEDTPVDDGLQSMQDKLDAITKTLQNMPGVAASAASAVGSAFAGATVWNPGPGATSANTASVDGAATGGLVTDYGIQHFARGGFVGGPSGTDTVPAWLTPGEVVLNKGQQQTAFGGSAAMLQSLSAGNAALHNEVRGLRADLKRLMDVQPMMLRHALRGL